MQECPITLSPMVVPVITNHGQLYEFTAITKVLLSNNSLDPLTRLSIETLTLKPDLMQPGVVLTDENKVELAALYRRLRRPPRSIVLNDFESIGLQPFIEDAPYEERLWDAAESGDHEQVRGLLELHPELDPNQENEDNVNPLWIAAFKGHIDVVRVLLENDRIDINQGGENELTPLHAAVMQGQWAVVDFLLRQDAIEADQKDLDAQTPFQWAVYLGNETVVNLFCNHLDLIDVNAHDEEGRTALYRAAHNDDISMVRKLLALPNILVNKPTLRGETPLLMATFRGHMGVVQLLLDDTRVDPFIKMPLLYAAHHEYREVVDVFFSKEIILDDFLKKMIEKPEGADATFSKYPMLLTCLCSHRDRIWEKIRHPGYLDLGPEAQRVLLNRIMASRGAEVPDPFLRVFDDVSAHSPILFRSRSILDEIQAFLDAPEDEPGYKRLRSSDEK